MSIGTRPPSVDLSRSTMQDEATHDRSKQRSLRDFGFVPASQIKIDQEEANV
jgi:hypothetical protein